MILRPDCRHFPGDRPCRPNKERGQTCPDCGEYAPRGQRILIIKLAALGDVLRTTVLLPGLKSQFPNSYVVWLTQQDSSPLLENNPYIDELWTLEGDAPALLAAEEFDLVLNPDADKRAAALASQARAREKRGMLLEPSGYVVPASGDAVTWLEMGAFDQLKKANQKSYQQLIYEMLRLDYARQEVVLELRDRERSWAASFLQSQGWMPGEKIAGINLGGGGRWKKKQWKPWHFEELARELILGNTAKVLMIGGPGEQALLAKLKANLPKGLLTTGSDLSLRETASLVARCQVMVTGDTLGLHMATALRVPTVVLTGPTSAAELEIYDRGEKIVAPIGCVCCYLPDCDVNPDCMQLITPSNVLASVMRYV